MSDEFDVNTLLEALENEDNEQLMNLDYEKIKIIKTNVLKNMGLNSRLYNELQQKLEHYRYVDEVPDLKYGGYIRWISLRKPDDIKLTTGGTICDIKVHDDGIHLVCRNRVGQYFQIRMYENVIFQKLSDQERVLLSAMSYLNK